MRSKQNRFSAEFKNQIVKEVQETGNATLVARKHDLVAGTVTRWVRESKDTNKKNNPLNQNYEIDSTSLEQENDQLKKILGEKDLEIAILRDLLKKNEPTIEEKVEIAKKWIDAEYKATVVLRIIKLNKSTYYYNINKPDTTQDRPRNKGGRPIPGYSFDINNNRVCDDEIKGRILEIIETEGDFYGCYKITVTLRRKYNLVINKKKVYRLCKELDILRPQRKIKPKHPRKIAINREITTSNALWEVDVKYGYIQGEDRFFYVLSYLDVYDRNIIDYHMGLSCKASDAAITLKRAMLKRNLHNKENNLVIRSDNGPQFKSFHFHNTCLELKLEHERIPNATPNKNAHIESFHRILEDECLSRHEFESFAHAYKEVAEFMRKYNNLRIHGSLGYITPREYYLQALTGTESKQIVKL